MVPIPATANSAQPEYKPPTTADGKTDWDNHSQQNRTAVGQLYWNAEEKQAHEKHQLQVVGDLARIEEAKVEQARIKAGGSLLNIDPTFASRDPRDILRRAAPPPYHFEDVPRSIGDFAYHYSQATGFDPSGVIVACVTAAASVIATDTSWSFARVRVGRCQLDNGPSYVVGQAQGNHPASEPLLTTLSTCTASCSSGGKSQIKARRGKNANRYPRYLLATRPSQHFRKPCKPTRAGF